MQPDATAPALPPTEAERETPPSLAASLPEAIFRVDQTPALFWASTPHAYSTVYAATAESETLGTRQMACASLRKPLSRCFGRPLPRT